MDFVLGLVEIGVKIVFAPVIVPREIDNAIDDLNGPPEDNWDPMSRTSGYDDSGADSNGG